MRKQTYPPVVTMRITSRCNNDCKYCYGPSKKIPEMTLEKLKILFKLLKKNNVKVVDLTGGEPLLRDDIREIIKELRSLDIKVFMNTSGDFFFEHKNFLIENLEGLGLTIDYPNDTLNYRNEHNFHINLDILKYMKSLKRRPLIRIGTVVTNENISKLNDIGNLLKGYDIDIWKLYQFIPQNKNAIKNRNLLEVFTEIFYDKTKNLVKAFSSDFKVIISGMKDRDSCYFFIGSDGMVFMPVQEGCIFHEISIGNVFDKDILSKWNSVVSSQNYIHNTEFSKKYEFKK